MSAAEELNPLYTAAMQFGMRGLRLLPVRHHSRDAILDKWQINATNSVGFIDDHFASGHNNLGLCCGPQPAGWNILCVDVDNRETWMALEAEYGPIDRDGLAFHRTPSGGLHLFFDVPAGMAVTGTDVFGVGIDARGGNEGNVGCGYVLLPPSVAASKSTGELLSYGAGPGKGLLDRAPGPAPVWLLRKIETHLNPPKREIQASVDRHPSSRPFEDETPGDWVRNHLTWDDYLLKHGWQPDGRYWVRPGKSARDGHSAQLHDDGRFAFWSQTDLPPGMTELGRRQVDGGYSISLFDFIAAYEFGGDRSAAGRYVRLELMPPPALPAGREDEPEAVLDDDTPDDQAWNASWFMPVDLTSVLDGTEQQAPPSILVRSDGMGLFYPGSINGIHGDSGLGKGWVAVVTAAEQIRAGHVVVYIDLEDTPASITSRLRTVGLTPDEIRRGLVYLRPFDESSPEATQALCDLCARRGATLVILDSLGEAFGLDAINEDKDAEVGPWLRKLPRKLADTGACVLIVDHATKAADNPLHPSGSKRKRAAVGGAAYLVEAVQPLTKGQGGRIRLTTAKDRHGFHRRNSVAAELVFRPSGEDMIVSVFAASENHSSPQEQRDNKVAEQAVRMLRYCRTKRAAFSKTDVIEGCEGAAKDIKRLAWALLVERGQVVEESKGKYKAVPNS